ncbi:oligosaccharyl transferase subunit ost3/OST6 [Mortierella sp. GBA30]|nr:oligosaccharyl transferase subunit ost3/OST6 [Mortierella sp. GBA30]
MGRLSRSLFLTLVIALVMALFVANSSHADQSADLLATKMTKLQARAAKEKGVIELDSASFDEVMAKPRNYSIVVLFTAISPEFQCVPCKNFDPEYRLVASGWSKLPDKSQLFFGILDFKAGQAIFQRFNMNSAPAALYFPSAESFASTPSFDRYDFAKSGFQAEAFANWLGARAGVQLKVQRPFDFMAFALKVLGLTGMMGLGRILYTRAGKVIRSKYLWAALSLVSALPGSQYHCRLEKLEIEDIVIRLSNSVYVLLLNFGDKKFTIFIMISGHMWNQIRHPPYTMPGRDGSPGFIAAGFQNQFGLETQIVAVMYAVLCSGVISLISSVPRIENPAKQRVAVWIWMAIFGIMFSILLQFFRLKNPAYPFRLLF